MSATQNFVNTPRSASLADSLVTDFFHPSYALACEVADEFACAARKIAGHLDPTDVDHVVERLCGDLTDMIEQMIEGAVEGAIFELTELEDARAAAIESTAKGNGSATTPST